MSKFHDVRPPRLAQAVYLLIAANRPLPKLGFPPPSTEWTGSSVSVPKTMSPLCDLGIFVNEAAEPVSAQNTYTRHFGRRRRMPGGRALPQRPVRPVGVAVIGQI